MVDAMKRTQPIPICVEQRSILKCVHTGSNPVLTTNYKVAFSKYKQLFFSETKSKKVRILRPATEALGVEYR